MSDFVKLICFLVIVCHVQLIVHGQSGKIWRGAGQTNEKVKLFNIDRMHVLDTIAKATTPQYSLDDNVEVKLKKLKTLIKRLELLSEKQLTRQWYSRHGR